MTKIQKLFATVAFSLIFCFVLVGYAALNDELVIDGSAEVEIPKIIFITDVKVKSTSGVKAEVNSYDGTVMNSTVTFNENSSSGTATYTVTIKNNTNFVSYYQGVNYDGTILNNSAITKVTASIATNDEKQPFNSLSEKTFDITLTYSKGSNSSSITTHINIMFSELTEKEEAVDKVLDRFDDILNDATEITENQGKSTFQALIEQMEKYSDNNRANDSYIGNVAGASSADKLAVNDFFTVTNDDGTTENMLHLTIGEKDVPVTIMIKNEDIYSANDGNEMVIYITPDTITNSRGNVTVYVAVFTKSTETVTNADGTTTEKTVWTQEGLLYQGEAPKNRYNGMPWGTYNSFNTDNWETTVAYYTTNSSNTAPSGSDIERVMKAYHEFKQKQ